MMNPIGVLALSLLLMVGCASERSGGAAGSQTSGFARSFLFNTIALDKPAYFAAAEGAPLLLPAGQYIVDSVDEAHLRLFPEDAAAPLLIAAALQTHEIEIPVPLVLAFSEKEDEPHVVLLLPNGRALDAAGSFTGIHSREIIRPNRRYSFRTETGTVQAEQPKEARDNSDQSNNVRSTIFQGPLIGTRVGQPISGPEAQNGPRQFEIQNLMFSYNQAQALAQSALAKLSGQFQLEFDTDRPGGDYALRAEATPEACREVCSSDQNCQAFTFVKPSAGSSPGQCFLKRTVPMPVGNVCCTSAKRKSTQEDIIQNIGK